MVQPLWKTIWWIFTKVNVLLPYKPVITPFKHPKELKIHVYTKPAHGCLQQFYVELPELRSNQNVLQWVNG